MEQTEREKYKLSKVEHERILGQINGEVFKNSISQKHPFAIIVGGQSGSGKGAVISYSKRQVEGKGKNVVIITTDEYKPFHPKAIELAKKYPTEYVRIIEQDVGPWTNSILKKAIDEKYNFIFEGTLKNNRILERIKELKQNGFVIIVRVLAVPRIESLLSIHERYQNQINNIGFGRLISVEQHNDAYTGIPQTIDEIEKSGLCVVEVFKRGRVITEPELVYSSNNARNFANARMALVETRKAEERKSYISARARVDALRKAYETRNATKEEFEELGKLEDYIGSLIK